MSVDRLPQVEKNLTRFRKQLHGKENALTSSRSEDWATIELQIEDLKAKMRPFEMEYWQILAERSTDVEISEPAPEIVVAELIEQAGHLQTSQEYSDEVLVWLQKIYAEVSQEEPSAAAKLKGALSLLPPFVNLSYEAELDTENFLRTHFPTFIKWSKALAKKS